jgi:hypothetical protein
MWKIPNKIIRKIFRKNPVSICLFTEFAKHSNFVYCTKIVVQNNSVCIFITYQLPLTVIGTIYAKRQSL